MAGLFKKSTGLTGLAVAANPHKTLSVLYDTLLRTLQKMPETAVYRQQTSTVIQQRLAVVKSEPTVEGLESKINCGQVEEVILQAERELSLARKMLTWRPWEPLVAEPPPNQWKWPI